MQGLRVLLLGGYGFFGSRLAARLALQEFVDLTIAGRSAGRGAALARELQGQGASRVVSAVLALDAPDLPRQLAELRPHVVVHTAGPFQGQDYRVARACIAAGCHYIDLADGRGFVAGIAELHEEAKAAGVAVISGASSVPALSSAVVDELAGGMESVEHIDIGITPGNRTDRGLSTLQAILGYCGQAVEMPGHPGTVGWSGSWRHTYPAPVGERLLSPCDVPDLALLQPRYPGQPAVRFGAGLELRFLHRAMNAMAWLARRGLVKDWSVHASALKAISEWFLRWGGDAGAMHVRVQGRIAGGQPLTREWQLLASSGDGPFVPTLAASALVQRLASGQQLPTGAMPCVGLLTPDEILRQAAGLAITAGEAQPLFQAVMGAAYARLHPAVRAFHDLQGVASLAGVVETEAPEGPLARFIGTLLGTPQRRASGAIRFELESGNEVQTWTRHFPGRTMRSRLRLLDGELVESLGPVRLTFALDEENGQLRMRLRGMRVLGIPCPAWLLPRILATESGEGDRLHFHIRAALPWIGRVTGYRGYLDLAPLPGSGSHA